MISLILITVLNSPHSPRESVQINPKDIKALRSSGSNCMVSHKDIEVEVKTEENCGMIMQRARDLKPAKATKKSKLQGWFAE